MLSWAAVFLIIAIIVGVLGAGGVAGMSMNIAWILFVVGLILAVVRIDVDSRDGVVSSSGAVESTAIIDRAQAVTAATEGMREVNDMMTVRSTN